MDKTFFSAIDVGLFIWQLESGIDIMASVVVDIGGHGIVQGVWKVLVVLDIGGNSCDFGVVLMCV